MKYVVVTGGVVSGLGKGVTASSIGVLLRACGLRITSIKIDPYLNTDAGTMSPFEHGEVYVLDDGGEVDLDLGNYERFLDIKLTHDNNITTGKIYQSVINKERKGVYLGKTVQVVPHITDEIQEWIERVASIPVDGKEGPADICVIELGGTIGDIESMPFIEALGQFSYRVGKGNFCLVHVSLVPVLNAVGEQKTKPTQHSVRGLRGLGLAPDILACRSAEALDENVKEKLSQFCHVTVDNIVNLYDVSNIWHIPLMLKEQKAHDSILKVLNLQSVGGVPRMPKLDEWTERARKCDSLDVPVRIAMVGKYTGLSDAYLSVLKALLHASVACNRKLVVNWVPSPDLEETTCEENPEAYHSAWDLLKGAEGILVPGGFGDRGVQGKILAAKYARENKIPFLGICLGMQIAVIEFARSVMKLLGANSTEFDPDTRSPCVIFMPEGSKTHMGGTMRLGSRRTNFQTSNCKAAKLYGNVNYVDERHRHRYEVNPEMVPQFEKAGFIFVGKDETQKRMEVCYYLLFLDKNHTKLSFCTCIVTFNMLLFFILMDLDHRTTEPPILCGCTISPGVQIKTGKTFCSIFRANSSIIGPIKHISPKQQQGMQDDTKKSSKWLFEPKTLPKWSYKRPHEWSREETPKTSGEWKWKLLCEW